MGAFAMWYKRFKLKHCSAMEPQTTDLGPPATILTLVTVLTKDQRIEHILWSTGYNSDQPPPGHCLNLQITFPPPKSHPVNPKLR